MRQRTLEAVVMLLLSTRSTAGFSVVPFTLCPSRRCSSRAGVSERPTIIRLSSSNQQDEDEIKDRKSIDPTTFDEAGRSLMDEQDEKRMQAMGDFDANPNVRERKFITLTQPRRTCLCMPSQIFSLTLFFQRLSFKFVFSKKSSMDQMEKMREAIRARTSAMGLEKSKVSADYIQQRQQQAVAAGSAKAASESSDTFAGLDLSQISTAKAPPSARNSMWGDDEEQVPSMFYDPEDELSEDERALIDPMGQKGILDQGWNELQNAKWPDPVSALKEVGIMIIVVAVTGALIIGWDKLLRGLYTDVLHFIPSKDDLMQYMNRFDGLDLPTGWTDNMNEADIASFTDKVSSSSGSVTLPDLE